MKAKIKNTGEIVNVDNLYDDGTALVNGEYIKVSKLDFLETTDWDKVRIQAAIAAVPAMIQTESHGVLFDSVALWAVQMADALIDQLKKGKEDK